MRAADFDYTLPKHLIAQQPLSARDQSRLLVLDRATGRIEHRSFGDLLDYMHPGDVMVLNDSRVIPARLRARKRPSGGQVEVLLLEPEAVNDWWAMLRPAKRVRPGTLLQLEDRSGRPASIFAEAIDFNAEGHARLRFSGTPDLSSELGALGDIPLPPYIQRESGRASALDAERYQTVFAAKAGSVAAPTAGLHFTEPILAQLQAKAVRLAHVTLHVGVGTFAPVKAEFPHQHVMHAERYELPADSATVLRAALDERRRVIAVGTTSVRVLESVARERSGCLVACQGRTDLFIYPPFQFKVVGALLTNFHLPRSTLLMLVSAFIAPGETRGRELLLEAYAEAIRRRYRFYSYGDAMLIL